MQTLLEIQSDLLRLKWHVAALRFQRAMRKHALALKAAFNPDQPPREAWTMGGCGGRRGEQRSR